jgi:hypothetical protein
MDAAAHVPLLAPCPTYTCPGAHGEFFDEPNLGPLAERIAVFLETPALVAMTASGETLMVRRSRS